MGKNTSTVTSLSICPPGSRDVADGRAKVGEILQAGGKRGQGCFALVSWGAT